MASQSYIINKENKIIAAAELLIDISQTIVIEIHNNDNCDNSKLMVENLNSWISLRDKLHILMQQTIDLSSKLNKALEHNEQTKNY